MGGISSIGVGIICPLFGIGLIRVVSGLSPPDYCITGDKSVDKRVRGVHIFFSFFPFWILNSFKARFAQVGMLNLAFLSEI